MSALLVVDEVGTGGAVVAADGDVRAALAAMFPDADSDAAAAIDAVVAGDLDAGRELLGVSVQADPDLASLDDGAWATWVAHLLTPTGSWHDGRVLIRLERPAGNGRTWPGGPVQVAAVHGDREQSWRHIETWPQLRQAVEEADAQEQAALDKIAAEKEREDAKFDRLRAAQATVTAAEQALERARRERDAEAAALLEQGVTAYAIARASGLSQPTIAKMRTRTTG